jgi:hypothetical protein
MATTAVFHPAHTAPPVHTAWPHALALFVYAGLPLGLFGLLHLGAEALGLLPFFFTPFGLPTWMGASAHLTQLALIGAACWAVTERHADHGARHWLVALGAAYIALPFVTPFLDSMLLAIVCTMLFFLAATTAIRAGSVSRPAGWMLAPMLAMVGLSAAMGLAVAAYAPPFALTQTQQAPPAA